ncbi:MAG TPA: hypothetical protein VLS90_11565, partial [Thermodesulfobacteriota bacterium]|nr:hypothetical protein [Thermodesulfobacteriota bacterium]
PNRNRPSVFHAYGVPGRPIRLRTEVGYDFNYQSVYLDNRADYLFDRWGQKSIGINTHADQNQWMVSLMFVFTQLFSFDRGAATRVSSDLNMRPEQAGVHGRVFIDTNANGIPDPGEPGLENVQVVLDNVHKATTDKDGYFLVPGFGRNKKARVFLDIETVPAIYSPTSGIQTANLNPKGLTEVNFGVAPLNSLSGIVQGVGAGGKIQPIYGVRVYLTKRTDDKVITDSITANDGTYYLGDVKPGKYYLRVDPGSLPPRHQAPDPKPIEIKPSKEPQEIKVPPLLSKGGSDDPAPRNLPRRSQLQSAGS